MYGKLVTLFGGSGFLGRYVAQGLLAAGVRIRLAERDPSAAQRVRPTAGLGKVQIVPANILRPESVAAALHGADAAVNLVGILSGDFQAVHVRGAENVARAAADAGLGGLVHISAIGADADSPSAYGRSKGQGEAAVRAAFPAATIIRPSILFGPEDQFTNRFAGLMAGAPFVPVLSGKTKFQPAYVVDVAHAIVKAALDPAGFGGRTFELGGPQVMTMRQVNEELARLTARQPNFIDVPDAAGSALASLTGWLPGAPITRDQWLMLQKDNVVGPDADGFAAFGIDPTPMGAVAGRWLVNYRKHGRFTDTDRSPA